MVELIKVNEVAEKAALAAFKGIGVTRVQSSPTVDSDGHEALIVTIVLQRGFGGEVTGDAALSAMVRIGRDLQNSGEERFPIIEFVTEEELDDSGDTES